MVAAFLIPAIFVIIIAPCLDNDSWFVLAEGRHLVENGIHYTDVLTMHDGLNIVVQNYGFAAIFYLIHSFLGAPGVYMMMLILNFAVCFLLYKICMLLSKKNVNLSLLIMLATDLLLAFGFAVTRAQMVDYVIILGLIYVLELFVKTGKSKYLWWVPVLSVLQINLHASVWWMLFLIIMVYIIDSINKPKLHLQGYKTRPLFVFAILGVLFGFLNPYGIKMITYVFTSYGVPEINAMVDEMKPFRFDNIFNAFLYCSLAVVSLFYLWGDKRRLRIRYILMFFGFLALGLNTIKGMSQFVLVMFFPLALVYQNVKIGEVIESEKARKAITLWGGVTCMAIFVFLCVVAVPLIKDSPDDSVVQAVDAIEDSGGDKESAKVYVGYNNGGYVEYRGYKAYLDPRAEVFIKKNNGKEDILREWEDFIERRTSVDEFLGKYKFDYLIADKTHEMQLYEMSRDDYEMIYENEDDEIRVFRKKDAKE